MLVGGVPEIIAFFIETQHGSSFVDALGRGLCPATKRGVQKGLYDEEYGLSPHK
jgi:hypothetical protein